MKIDYNNTVYDYDYDNVIPFFQPFNVVHVSPITRVKTFYGFRHGGYRAVLNLWENGDNTRTVYDELADFQFKVIDGLYPNDFFGWIIDSNSEREPFYVFRVEPNLLTQNKYDQVEIIFLSKNFLDQGRFYLVDDEYQYIIDDEGNKIPLIF